MGGEQSRYVKVKISQATGLAAKFAFERGTGNNKTYKMVTIYTNPTIVSKEIVNIPKKDYDDKSWEWYEYDGNVNQMIKIFDEFDPQPQNLGALLTRLEMECEMKSYKNLWEKIKYWLDMALTITGRLLSTIVGPVAMPLLYAYQAGF